MSRKERRRCSKCFGCPDRSTLLNQNSTKVGLNPECSWHGIVPDQSAAYPRIPAWDVLRQCAPDLHPPCSLPRIGAPSPREGLEALGGFRQGRGKKVPPRSPL